MASSPRIRFGGFSDAWEQHKLGEVAPLRGGYAFKSDEYKTEGTPIVRISNILSDGSVGAEFAYYDDIEDDENITLGNGDALLAMSGATTGKVSILKCNNIDKYYQNQRVGYFERNEQYNYGFVSTIVRSDLFKEQLTSVLVAGAQPNVSSKEIDSFEFMFPSSIEEQEKIGQYFQNFDNLITLHQRKYDKLIVMKKSMLEKMFPKNGETVPEVRFAGFTDAWKQRKLGELCEITTGKLDANAMVQDGQFDFYTSGIDVYKIDKVAFEGPAITIAGNGASVGYMHLADGKFNAYQRTYVLTDFLADRQFLNVSIGNELPSKIQEEVRGSGIPYIVLNMLTDLIIPFPSQSEQKKIGEYFRNLDNLITLHQSKLEKLQNLKKSMLQQMFV